METYFSFFIELDKLKSVFRQTYISDVSRKENSAEHSWHLALALMTLAREIDLPIDLDKALRMALVHDICEIGAGDISVYHPERHKKEALEREYLEVLASGPLKISQEIKELWEEYEAQQSLESRWVKVVDRLLPFMLNIATEGRNWKELKIRASHVRNLMKIIAPDAPDIYNWILKKVDAAVEEGWLLPDE